MGKGIDWAAIEEFTSDPTLFYQGAEAEARNDATMRKMAGLSGPPIRVVDLPGGGFRLDIDLEKIELRGRDRDRDPEGDETRSGSVERSEIEPGPKASP